MLYVIYAQDVANSLPLRLSVRPAHLARLESLKEQGRLVIAGPCPAIDSPTPGEAGFTGSVVIAEFDSLLDAQQWADSDPYVGAGVFKSAVVKPFSQTLP